MCHYSFTLQFTSTGTFFRWGWAFSSDEIILFPTTRVLQYWRHRRILQQSKQITLCLSVFINKLISQQNKNCCIDEFYHPLELPRGGHGHAWLQEHWEASWDWKLFYFECCWRHQGPGDRTSKTKVQPRGSWLWWLYFLDIRAEFILKSCSNFYWHRDLGLCYQ